jgi:hypothetical protein
VREAINSVTARRKTTGGELRNWQQWQETAEKVITATMEKVLFPDSNPGREASINGSYISQSSQENARIFP